MKKDMTVEEKFNELSENPAFLNAAKSADGKDDLLRIFREYGMDVSREDIDGFVSMTYRALAEDSLSEEELENVSGGISPGTIFKTGWHCIKKVAKTCWNWGKKFADWEG